MEHSRYQAAPAHRERQEQPHFPEQKCESVGTAAGTRRERACPGCGSPDVLPGRVYCRPSCRARHQHREGQRAPRLPDLLDVEAVLVTELPEAPRPAAPRQQGHPSPVGTPGALAASGTRGSRS